MINIEEKYPKSTKVVVDFFLEKLLESLKDDNLPEDFKENVRKRGVKPSMLLTLLNEAPRNLLDVFDANQLFIEINITNTPKIEDMFFSFSINNIVEQNGLQAATYKNRKEAEKAAVEKAFELLEEKLI